jgi:hypothetical protein
MERSCTPEQREACPLVRHFEDTHHLAYPRRDYKTAVEKRWRELPERKVEICRWLHQNIHASGYLPAKPDREDMLTDIWAEQPSQAATSERDKQLFLGNLTIDRPEGIA